MLTFIGARELPTMTFRTSFGALALALAAFAAAMPASAQDWQAGAGEDWKQMLAAAKKEGTVVVAGPSEIGKPMADAFKRDTGIEMEFLGSVGAAMVTRMTREYKSGNVTMDVVFSGAITLSMTEFMEPLLPKLILPGVTDPKNWVGGKMKFADNAGTYIPYFGEQVSGYPLINTDLIKPGTIAGWNDLLKPEYKGKIAIYDPRVPGPGVANSSFLADALGLDYIKKLYIDQQPKFSRDARQLVEWVARGVNPIAVGVSFNEIENFKSSGIKNIDIVEMPNAPLRVTASFYPHVPKKAPHPNAALVFMNWYASKPGQEVNSRTQVMWSRRTDVVIPGQPESIKPKPGVYYNDQYAEDFVLNKRDKLVEEIRKIVGDDK
jgi:ABC-type Fe3+ transport system substrate-binding protein